MPIYLFLLSFCQFILRILWCIVKYINNLNLYVFSVNWFIYQYVIFLCGVINIVTPTSSLLWLTRYSFFNSLAYLIRSEVFKYYIWWAIFKKTHSNNLCLLIGVVCFDHLYNVNIYVWIFVNHYLIFVCSHCCSFFCFPFLALKLTALVFHFNLYNVFLTIPFLKSSCVNYNIQSKHFTDRLESIFTTGGRM